MLSNDQYPVAQRETLIRIIRDRRIKRGVSDRNARRRGNHPPNMLIRLVPHLDPKGQIVAECHASSDWLAAAATPQLGSTPPTKRSKGFCTRRAILAKAERVQLALAVVFDHANKMRTVPTEVKPLWLAGKQTTTHDGLGS